MVLARSRERLRKRTCLVILNGSILSLQNRISPENPQPDYVTMHEIARHTIHSSETLVMAKETMTSLVQEHEIFFEENGLLPARTITLSKQTRRIFRSQITLINCLYLRSKALEERLQNEINLVVFAISHKKDRANHTAGIQHCRSTR